MKFLKSAIAVIFSLGVFVACGSNGNNGMNKKTPNTPNKGAIQNNPGTMNQGTIKSRKDTVTINKDTTDSAATMPSNKDGGGSK